MHPSHPRRRPWPTVLLLLVTAMALALLAVVLIAPRPGRTRSVGWGRPRRSGRRPSSSRRVPTPSTIPTLQEAHDAGPRDRAQRRHRRRDRRRRRRLRGLGLLTIGAAASTEFADLLNLYAPSGPLTGKATVASLIYLIVWVNLHFRLRDRELSLSVASC